MFKKSFLAIALVAGGLNAFGAAAAQPYRNGPPGREGVVMMPFEAVLSPEQKQALLSMVKADQTKLESLRQRLHQAREALIEKLVSPDASVDVSKEVTELKAAQAAMTDERVAIALEVRKLLSAQQLKDAAAFHGKLEELHRQEATLLRQMEGGKGGSRSGPDD